MGNGASRRVAIVTDSTCDLPKDLVAKFGIQIVPQTLIMGDQTWLDGVDIDPPAFYELLRTSSQFPSTSQPTVAYFQEVFGRVAKEAGGIVAILVSDELSGTINSACLAAETMPGTAIEIIDSRSVSLGLGYMVLEAARVAATGADLQAVADTARGLVGRIQVHFIVDTLEYLHRGGRIGAAKRLFGTALNLKPILTLLDGQVSPLTNVRSRRKAIATLLQLVEDELAGAERVHVAVLHIAAREEADRLAEQLAERFEPVEMFFSECGPVVGAHAGPGTLGIAFYAE
jgi:DegV family protein with EDD domain